MQIDIRKEIAVLTAETLQLRRDIHAHPELGFREFRTTKIIEERLVDCGVQVRRCADTGVIGVLAGAKPGAQAFAAAAALAGKVDAMEDVHASKSYRQHLALNLTERALNLALERAAR
jgi:amidohydrolase